MSSKAPHTLTPATRNTALAVARAIFYLGLFLGSSFAAVAVALLVFKAGNFPLAADRNLVGGALALLGVLSFGIAWGGKASVAKMKKSG